MVKNKIKSGVFLYPMPIVIVGALVNIKPNFMPIAWCNIVEHKPPMIFISAHQSHYTNNGIKENNTFSVNIPSADMAELMDYLGIKSGRDIDKSNLFEIFYGDLKSAPMITQAPINLECKVVKTVDIETGHEIFIGEIVNVYAEEKYLTKGIPDVKKFNPIVFTMNDNNYWKIGEHIGRAWSIGRNYKPK